MRRPKADNFQSSAARSASAEQDIRAFLGMPGHLIRRSKQKSTQIFTERCAGHDVTPVQFAVLRVLQIVGELERGELRGIVGLDNSTFGDIIARLQKRDLVSCRLVSSRQQLCSLTPAGSLLATALAPIVHQAQEAILTPLTARERRQLLRLLSKLVGLNTDGYSPRTARRQRSVGDVRRPDKKGAIAVKSGLAATPGRPL